VSKLEEAAEEHGKRVYTEEADSHSEVSEACGFIAGALWLLEHLRN
jgi:hypothetical protein